MPRRKAGNLLRHPDSLRRGTPSFTEDSGSLVHAYREAALSYFSSGASGISPTVTLKGTFFPSLRTLLRTSYSPACAQPSEENR